MFRSSCHTGRSNTWDLFFLFLLMSYWKLISIMCLKLLRNTFKVGSPLPISMLGIIGIIKMNVLPRMLYPLQMLPNPIPVFKNFFFFFRMLHGLIRKFVWKNKHPRFKLQKWQLPVQRGGLALPNFIYYHWASQMRSIVDWIKNDDNSSFLDLQAIGSK